MICSCPSYSSGNMCKHIHYWRRLTIEKSQKSNSDDFSENNQLTVVTSSERDDEIRHAVDDINLITHASSLSAEKKELVDLIAVKIHSLQSSQEIQSFRKSLENLMEDNHSRSQDFIQSSQSSLKRKIERQKRFCTTRKPKSGSSQGSVRRSQSLSSTPSHPITTLIVQQEDL